MNEQREALAETVAHADHCHGLVTRDGIADACGKPPVAIIDGRSTEDQCYWPACAYHAHRYGRGNVVPLARLIADAEQRGAARGWEEARTELLDALASTCDECHGTGQSVQGWTDKHGYSENQYGPCHACAERVALAAQDPA